VPFSNRRTSRTGGASQARLATIAATIGNARCVERGRSAGDHVGQVEQHSSHAGVTM